MPPRHVDDTLTIVGRDQVGALEERLSNIFLDVQFTVDIEKDKKLPFLDFVVKKTTNHGLQESHDHNKNDIPQ